MLLSADYVLPITSEPLEKGAVLVRNGRIADVGPAAMMRVRYPDEEVRDFGRAALLPGFVDVHSHMEYSIMRGLAHDVPYATWLISVNEIAARMTPDDLYFSAVLGGLEALASGITCMADITPNGATIRALRDLGMRGVVYREVIAMDRTRVDYAMNQAVGDIERWRANIAGDRITVGIAPAALYVCHPTVFSRVSEYAGSTTPVAIHVGGSFEEYDFIRSGTSPFAVDILSDKRGYVEMPPWLPTGVTPVNYALNWGAFDAEQVLAVHAVHVSDDDINHLRQRNVSIAWCPRCNAQLGMGVAPVNEYLRAGMRVGIGTDSPAATESADLLDEMRIGMLVQRSVNPREFITAATMLEMATLGGAKALHMEDKIGSLGIGKHADIIAVDLSGSHQTAAVDPVGALVNTGQSTEVLMSMVEGDILYERNEWNVGVDVAHGIARSIEIREKLRS